MNPSSILHPPSSQRFTPCLIILLFVGLVLMTAGLFGADAPVAADVSPRTSSPVSPWLLMIPVIISSVIGAINKLLDVYGTATSAPDGSRQPARLPRWLPLVASPLLGALIALIASRDWGTTTALGVVFGCLAPYLHQLMDKFGVLEKQEPSPNLPTYRTILFCAALLAIAVPLLTGCSITKLGNTPGGKIISVENRGLGLFVAWNAADQSPSLKFGYAESKIQFIPTATNAVYSAPFSSSFANAYSGFSGDFNSDISTLPNFVPPETPVPTNGWPSNIGIGGTNALKPGAPASSSVTGADSVAKRAIAARMGQPFRSPKQSAQ